MEIDFSDPERRAALARAATLIAEAYEILAEEVGAPNPSDNAFLREALVCAATRITWRGERGGIDATDPRTGGEVEIKSTKLAGDRAFVEFPTSRAISPTVIARFRAAEYWLFAAFDNYGNMAIVYRVERAGMRAKIDALERKMRDRAAGGEPLLNNPKTTLNSIHHAATVVHRNPDFEEHEIAPGRWCIRRR